MPKLTTAPSIRVYRRSMIVLLSWPIGRGRVVKLLLPPFLGRPLYVLVMAMRDDLDAGEDATMRGFRHHVVIRDALALLPDGQHIDVATVASYLFQIRERLHAACKKEFGEVEVPDLFFGDSRVGTRVTREDFVVTSRDH